MLRNQRKSILFCKKKKKERETEMRKHILQTTESFLMFGLFCDAVIPRGPGARETFVKIVSSCYRV